jgi:phosphonate degradation associated HDIG domain protein
VSPRPPSAAEADKARFVDRLFDWFEEAGQSRYDEPLSQCDHALQTAWLARRDEAPSAQVVAALFHDIGHLLIDEHSARDDFLKSDGKHETVGATWLSTAFPEAVAAPVRLHVPAKRWLCARERGYHDRLSRASRHSLALQGRAMTGDEAAAFEDQPYWREAVALRKWDDGAKLAGRAVPGFADYRETVLALLALPAD